MDFKLKYPDGSVTPIIDSDRKTVRILCKDTKCSEIWQLTAGKWYKIKKGG